MGVASKIGGCGVCETRLGGNNSCGGYGEEINLTTEKIMVSFKHRTSEAETNKGRGKMERLQELERGLVDLWRSDPLGAILRCHQIGREARELYVNTDDLEVQRKLLPYTRYGVGGVK
jgi:hypothetical protein